MSRFLLLLLCCVLPILAASPASAAKPRVFDIVPAEGQVVEQVNGTTVLRLPMQGFGVVLAFVPESAKRGWVPVALLNSGAVPLAVSEADFSAASGQGALAVHGHEALVAEHRQWLRDSFSTRGQANASRRAARVLGGGGRAMTTGAAAHYVSDSQVSGLVGGLSKPVVERQWLQAQESEFAARLLKPSLVAPGEVLQGELCLDLPAPVEGAAAEFVLRLVLAGETVEIRYRERLAGE